MENFENFGNKGDYEKKKEQKNIYNFIEEDSKKDVFELFHDLVEQNHDKYVSEINDFKLRILKREKFDFCEKISDEFKNQIRIYANEVGSGGDYKKLNGRIIGNILEHLAECEKCEDKRKEISQLVEWSASDNKIENKKKDINEIQKRIDKDIICELISDTKEGHVGFCKNASKEMVEDMIECANRAARGGKIEKNNPLFKKAKEIEKHLNACQCCLIQFSEIYDALRTLFDSMKKEGIDLKHVDTNQMLKDFYNIDNAAE